MESMVGMHSELQAIRIRQLYDDLDCDYIVIDRQGNGISVYENLCKNLYDKERGTDYQALNSINEEKMQNLCLVPGAEKKIWTISATPDFNSQIAYLLKNDINRGKIRFLVNKNESYEYLGKFKDFATQRAEIKAKLQAPYYQTDALINEMVLLESEINDDKKIKLKEKSGNRKDRYTSLAYGNYFANELERKLLKRSKKTNIDDYCKPSNTNIMRDGNLSPFGNRFINPFGGNIGRKLF
jgi:hypothetical protein